MPITRTAMIDDDGTGTTGTILNNAWKQELYTQIDGVTESGWIDVAFNPADFTAAAGGTWTVAGATTFAYRVTGKVLTIAFAALNTSVAGGPPSLNIRIPGGFTVNRQVGQPFNYAIGGVGTGTGYMEVAPAINNQLRLHRDMLGTAWAAGGTHVSGLFVISIA
jgi:hypothetical protein